MKDCLLEVGGIPCNQNPLKCARLVNWQIGDGTGNSLRQDMLDFADDSEGVNFITGLIKSEMSRSGCRLNDDIRSNAAQIKRERG